jgi:hypothetical protein
MRRLTSSLQLLLAASLLVIGTPLSLADSFSKSKKFTLEKHIGIGNLIGANEVLAMNTRGRRQARRSAGRQSASQYERQGDQMRAAGNYKGALAAYRKAEQLGGRSDDLTFKIADTYKDMGAQRQAYWEFHKAQNSKVQETRLTACEQMEYLKEHRNKKLRPPYFADLYTNAGVQTIGDAAFVDMKARWGIEKGKERPFRAYLFAYLTRDNQSGNVGGFPQSFFDNVGIVGVGIQKKLLKDQGLYFIAEHGRARDLINMNRDRNRDDTRAGFEYYQEWGTSYNCRTTKRRPNRFVMVASAELKYYTRYNDATIFQLDLRPGIRLFETRKSSVDAFLIAGTYRNLDDTDNSYNEFGAGISWVPNRQRDFKITLRATHVKFETGGSDENVVLEFHHYIKW